MAPAQSVLSKEAVIHQALQLGWDDAAITTPTIPQADIGAYNKWIAQQNHAQMGYMEKEIRCWPEKLLPGAQSAILFVSYYKNGTPPSFEKDRGVIASYARGRDYHNIHRSRIKKFSRWLREQAGEEIGIKGFSDSVPILEKALAVKAGLGWFGKNTLLIHRKYGTFTLLSGVLTTLSFPDSTENNERTPRCGTCTKCLDACPTSALTPYTLNAARCLSYQLIESKEKIPEEISQKNPGYIFGCDICQNVCPHNMRKPDAALSPFHPSEGLGATLDKETLDQLAMHPEKLYGTPLKRSGAKRMKEALEG